MRVSASTFLSMTRIDWPGGAEAFEAAPDLVADQRRQAFGRFVEDEQPRVGHQRPADRQHLLLAAGEQVRHDAGALGEPRKQRKDFVERPRIGGGGAVSGGGDQVFARGEIGKNLAAFGHQADAELGDAVGRQLADVLAVEPDRARRAGVSPMIERTVVVLPMPLRPISETISPGAMVSEIPNSTRLRP